MARVADIHLHSYRLDYATDLATNEWLQVYVKGDLYKQDPAVLLPEPEMRIGGIQQEWEVPVKEGQVTDFLTPSNSDSVDLSFALLYSGSVNPSVLSPCQTSSSPIPVVILTLSVTCLTNYS